MLSGSLDAKLWAFAALVPAGAMVTCWHEGEAAAHGLTASPVLGLHARCRPPEMVYGHLVVGPGARLPDLLHVLGRARHGLVLRVARR